MSQDGPTTRSFQGTNIVPMPWHSEEIISFLDLESNEEHELTRWHLVQVQLKRHIPDVNTLEDAIQSYNVLKNPDGTQSKQTVHFRILRKAIDEMTDEKRAEFFAEDGVLKSIQNYALGLKRTWRNIKWLQSGEEGIVRLTQLQAAGILAHSFFCTHPPRLPSINFSGLFTGGGKSKTDHVVEKLKCILHYFLRIHKKMPDGEITYQKLHTADNCYPRFNKLAEPLIDLKIDSTGVIEDAEGHLQADFANKVVGGGVLGWGCVQEEIRFTICPELIVARLFTKELHSNDAMIITGAERFCNYTGYSNDFCFAGDYRDPCAQDTQVLVIDAIRFSKRSEQYREGNILRELKKLYTGLKPLPGSTALPFATGNWGCGAFGGDPELKCLLQLIAASITKRPVLYFTFNNEEFANNLQKCYDKLKHHSITVKQLYEMLKNYLKKRNKDQSVFSFVLNVTAKCAQTAAASAQARAERALRWGDAAGPGGLSTCPEEFGKPENVSGSIGGSRNVSMGEPRAGSSTRSDDYAFYNSALAGGRPTEPRKPAVKCAGYNNARREHTNSSWAMEDVIARKKETSVNVAPNKFYPRLKTSNTSSSEDSTQQRHRKLYSQKAGSISFDQMVEGLAGLEDSDEVIPSSQPDDKYNLNMVFGKVSRNIVGSSPFHKAKRKDVAPLPGKFGSQRRSSDEGRSFQDAFREFGSKQTQHSSTSKSNTQKSQNPPTVSSLFHKQSCLKTGPPPVVGDATTSSFIENEKERQISVSDQSVNLQPVIDKSVFQQDPLLVEEGEVFDANFLSENEGEYKGDKNVIQMSEDEDDVQYPPIATGSGVKNFFSEDEEDKAGHQMSIEKRGSVTKKGQCVSQMSEDEEEVQHSRSRNNNPLPDDDDEVKTGQFVNQMCSGQIGTVTRNEISEDEEVQHFPEAICSQAKNFFSEDEEDSTGHIVNQMCSDKQGVTKKRQFVNQMSEDEEEVQHSIRNSDENFLSATRCSEKKSIIPNSDSEDDIRMDVVNQSSDYQLDPSQNLQVDPLRFNETVSPYFGGTPTIVGLGNIGESEEISNSSHHSESLFSSPPAYGTPEVNPHAVSSPVSSTIKKRLVQTKLNFGVLK